MTTDWPDYNPSQHRATAIAGTGVPLLTKSTLIKNQAAISQNPGTANNSATFSMPQIGYEIILTIYATGNFTSFYSITMTWFDSVSGQQTGQEEYFFIPGTGAGGNSHQIFGTGPTKGDQLVITSTVPGTSSVAVTHAYVVLNNSRVYAEDNWVTTQFNSAGVTGAASDSIGGLLAAGSFTVPASGGIVTRLMPFFNGVISLYATTTSGLADLDVQIAPFADPLQVGGSSPTMFEQMTNANGFMYQSQIPLPASQCQVQFTNKNAAIKTVQFAAIISKQR